MKISRERSMHVDLGYIDMQNGLIIEVVITVHFEALEEIGLHVPGVR